MTDEAYLAVTGSHRDLYIRHSFYLLAVVGAAVGFALNQTKGAVLAYSQIPLGLAMLSWSLSFYFGLRQLRSILATLGVNSLLLELQFGQNTELSHIPKAPEIIKGLIEEHGKSAGRFHIWQVQALLIGVFFYVGWHVLEMYLRQHSSS